MTDKNRIEMIGRYMSGHMRPDELAEFQHRLRSDAPLKKMMEAEALIRTTIRRDLDAIPTNHPATRMRVMDLLADASHHAPTIVGGTAGGASTGAVLSWITKVFLGSILGLGLATGGYMLVNSDRAEQPEPSPAVSAPLTPAPAGPAREIEHGTPREAISSPEAPAADEESRPPAALQPASKDVPLQSQRAQSREGTRTSAPARARERSETRNPVEPTAPSNDGAVAPTPTTPSQPKKTPRRVIPNDAVKVEIQVNDGKPKQ